MLKKKCCICVLWTCFVEKAIDRVPRSVEMGNEEERNTINFS